MSLEGSPKIESKEGIVNLTIFPGVLHSQNDPEFPGQPMAYFVRSEGTTDTHRPADGSLERIMQELFGSEILDFIAGVEPPETQKKWAEEMAVKVNNPEFQTRVRKLYAERELIRKELDL